uniref:Cytochrome P450 n=1 Tax=Oryza glumipatula TaxID=40148 RepID=A0A0D9YGA1_9ORYZ
MAYIQMKSIVASEGHPGLVLSLTLRMEGGLPMKVTSRDFDELREMHYLHAAITEAMRLYPPVAMDSHCCQNDDVLPDGTFVGKGWQVTYSAYAMARLEELWGADCEEFRPERWLDEDGVFRPESPFKYPVFHGGPRMCLGKEMAYIQMKSIAACVFERFSFRFVGGEGRPGLVFSVTLRMEGGLPMRVKKRRDSVC